MHRRPAYVLAVASLTWVGLTGCGGDDSSSSGPRVMAASYPFAFVVERVAGDTVEVQSLTSPGGEPHDLELTPRQVADVSEAELVVYASGFQPSVDDAIGEADLPADALLDVAEVADALVTGFSTEHEEHAGNEEHADEEHAEDEHAEEELDPHVWLDPVRMIDFTAAVEERLVAIDPDNARTYRDNAVALTRELEQLHDDFERRLADCERRTIVTSHAAFAYLAERYDLTQVAIGGLDPASEPSPAQQAEVADMVESQGITTVFTEALVSSAVAESIADETGVSVARLDPIEGLSDETADQTYLTLMEANLAAISEANGCS